MAKLAKIWYKNRYTGTLLHPIEEGRDRLGNIEVYGYGFQRSFGESLWFHITKQNDGLSYGGWNKATAEQVREALIDEAKRKRYGESHTNHLDGIYLSDKDQWLYDENSDTLYADTTILGRVIYRLGEWATRSVSVKTDSEKAPSKFCIKPTSKEEGIIVGQYFDKNYGCSGRGNEHFYEDMAKENKTGYFANVGKCSVIYSSYIKDEGYTEISFEQFVKFFVPFYSPKIEGNLSISPAIQAIKMPELPSRMLVWDADRSQAIERVVVAHAPGLPSPWIAVTPEFEDEYGLGVDLLEFDNWKHVEVLPPALEVTLKEVASKFGVDRVKIVEC